jgi:ankyrin repeat protein
MWKVFFSERNGCSPLHCSSANGHVEISRLLVEANSDVNAKTFRNEEASRSGRAQEYGDSPLHFSSRAGRLEVCRLLVEAKADVNAKTSLVKDNEYDPPYMRA